MQVPARRNTPARKRRTPVFVPVVGRVPVLETGSRSTDVPSTTLGFTVVVEPSVDGAVVEVDDVGGAVVDVVELEVGDVVVVVVSSQLRVSVCVAITSP